MHTSAEDGKDTLMGSRKGVEIESAPAELLFFLYSKPAQSQEPLQPATILQQTISKIMIQRLSAD
jgi:hypothetical protein